MPFSSATLLQREFGLDAMVAWSDHEESGTVDTAVIDDALIMADQEIMFAINGVYSEAQLATSPLVRYWATLLAGYHLFNNRGNSAPEHLKLMIKEVRDMMKLVADGLRKIPGLTATGLGVPTVSNRMVDRRYGERTIRIQHQSSTPPSTSELGREVFDMGGPFGYDP